MKTKDIHIGSYYMVRPQRVVPKGTYRSVRTDGLPFKVVRKDFGKVEGAKNKNMVEAKGLAGYDTKSYASTTIKCSTRSILSPATVEEVQELRDAYINLRETAGTTRNLKTLNALANRNRSALHLPHLIIGSFSASTEYFAKEHLLLLELIEVGIQLLKEENEKV